MRGKFGVLSPGKVNSHSTALSRSPRPLPMCAVFLCFHTTDCEACSFTTYGFRIFNVRITVGACRRHEGGSGKNKSAQELTRRDRQSVSHPAPPGDRTQTDNLSLTLPRQGIEPRQTICLSPCPARGSNPGSSGLSSGCVTAELRPLSCPPQALSQPGRHGNAASVNGLVQSRHVSHLSKQRCQIVVKFACVKFLNIMMPDCRKVCMC